MKRDMHVGMRALIGAPVAVIINMCILIGISTAIGDGTFYAAVPEAAEYYGSQLTAVVIQFISMLVYGAVWGAASVFWEIPSWSLLKQTIVNFAVAAGATFVVLWINFWTPHTAGAVLAFFGLFILIYVCIWIGIYIQTKRRIREINKKMNTEE